MAPLSYRSVTDFSLGSNWKWPNIPNLESFQGDLIHTANWPKGFDYTNKTVAVIGNGSSGIQIVPQMAKLPGNTVRNFVRGAAWVYYRLPPSRHLGREVDDPNPEYLEEEILRWQDPEEHQKYRKGIIDRTNKAFKLVSYTIEEFTLQLLTGVAVPQR